MKRKVTWPTGSTVTLKCEDSRPCFDQTPFRVTVREETPDAWVGWPVSWQDRGLNPIEYRPIMFPKFAWVEVTS